MQLLTRVARAAVLAAGLLALLVPQLHNARLAGATPLRARALAFSHQARRLLIFRYQSYATEFLSCTVGVVRGNAVIVQRIAPADVDPAESTPASVVPRQTCENAGWATTVGMIRSHPSGQRSFYYSLAPRWRPPMRTLSRYKPYPVDTITCGNRIVRIGRDLIQKQQPLAAQGGEAR